MQFAAHALVNAFLHHPSSAPFAQLVLASLQIVEDVIDHTPASVAPPELPTLSQLLVRFFLFPDLLLRNYCRLVNIRTISLTWARLSLTWLLLIVQFVVAKLVFSVAEAALIALWTICRANKFALLYDVRAQPVVIAEQLWVASSLQLVVEIGAAWSFAFCAVWTFHRTECINAEGGHDGFDGGKVVVGFKHSA